MSPQKAGLPLGLARWAPFPKTDFSFFLTDICQRNCDASDEAATHVQTGIHWRGSNVGKEMEVVCL